MQVFGSTLLQLPRSTNSLPGAPEDQKGGQYGLESRRYQRNERLWKADGGAIHNVLMAWKPAMAWRLTWTGALEAEDAS